MGTTGQGLLAPETPKGRVSVQIQPGAAEALFPRLFVVKTPMISDPGLGELTFSHGTWKVEYAGDRVPLFIRAGARGPDALRRGGRRTP
jgi:hypothetical protein